MAGKYCSSRECSYWRYRSSPRGSVGLATSAAIMSYMAVVSDDISRLSSGLFLGRDACRVKMVFYASEDCQNSWIVKGGDNQWPKRKRMGRREKTKGKKVSRTSGYGMMVGIPSKRSSNTPCRCYAVRACHANANATRRRSVSSYLHPRPLSHVSDAGPVLGGLFLCHSISAD